MFSILPSVALLLSLFQSHANLVDARPQSTGGLAPRQNTGEPCSDIFNTDYFLFTAVSVYECLVTAPFNSTVALELLGYYNDTLQFQTTLAYLKDPPASYQQPAVDVIGGLNNISQRVQAGEFKNEYTFEVTLQELVYAMHDDHVTLNAGILSAFTFGSPLRIVSASTDGLELPKIYIVDDLIEAIDTDVKYWTPSAVITINGVDVVTFLTQFAAIHAPGNVEPHADYNDLMSSAAGDVQGMFSAFEGNTIFYPGENITFNFENGSTTHNLPWIAWYSTSIIESPPSLSTGQELYDYFVFGIAPVPNSTAAASTAIPAAASTSVAVASTTVADPAATTTGSSDASPSSWDYFPYPNNPVVSQPNLGSLNGGFLSGYFLNDGITAVLSIPTFDMTAESVATFSSTISDFLEKSKAAGLTRFVIDLQRNDGGSELLATDAFKQFFPTLDPFNGARLRAHPFADALGNTYTNYYTTESLDADLYAQLSASIWVAPVYLNAATGQNFTSWPEFFGPHLDKGDTFTTPQRDNLSSIIFDKVSTGDGNEADGIVVFGFANRTSKSAPPYPAEQIVLLTDGFCSSGCATFVELMHHQAGVRTVVVGGRPEHGPMQAVAGSRGGEPYTSVALDSDIQVAEIFNETVSDILPDRDTGNYINFAEFNIKDALRPGENFPLQFAYEAATCRIFYTKHTVYNYVNLWNYVVDAVWRNPSLCIDGSANGTTILPTNTTGPTQNQKAITEAYNEDIANLILTGISSGPQSPQPEKRDIPTPTVTDDAPVSPNPSHLLVRQLVNIGTCAACGKKSGFACLPTCIRNQIQTGSECVRTCQGNSATCERGDTCRIQSGKGYCVNSRQIRNLDSCKTPTRDIRSQNTQAVGDGNFALPYGMHGRRINRP